MGSEMCIRDSNNAKRVNTVLHTYTNMLTLFSAYTFLRVNIVFCLHKHEEGLLGCYLGTKITPGSDFSGGPRRAYRVGFWYFLCRKQKVVKLHAKSGARRDHLTTFFYCVPTLFSAYTNKKRVFLDVILAPK